MTEPAPPRRGWLLALLILGTAALAYSVVPMTPFDSAYPAIGVATLVVMIVGSHRNQPARRAPWLLVTAGLALLVAGDLTYVVLYGFAGDEPAFPGAADFAYLSGMLVMVSGGIAFVVDRQGSATRRTLIDAGIVAGAASLLLWLSVGSSLVTTPGASAAEVVVGLAYPALDVGLLGVLTAWVLSGRVRSASQLLLTGGIGVLLVTDLVYAFQAMGGTYALGGILDSGWLAAYGLIAVAALHPSMTRPPVPSKAAVPELSRRHLVGLWVPVLAAGSGLMLSGSRMVHDDPSGFLLNLMVAVPIGLAICTLLLWRVASASSELAATARERDATRSRELTVADVAARLALADDLVSVRIAVDVASSLCGDTGVVELHLPGDPEPQGASSNACRVPLTPDPTDGCLLVRGSAPVPDDVLGSLRRIASDVTMAIDRCRLAAELRSNERRFRSLVRHAPDAITVHDAFGRLTYVSPALGRIVGVDEDQLVGARWRDLLHPDDLPRVATIHEEILATPRATVVIETRLRGPDGDWRWIESRMTNLMNDPSVGGIVANHRDITERQHLQRQLEHQATHDALTGLANRRQFSDAVREVLLRGHNAVIFLDLDRFKDVNDRLGHSVGDRLLQATADRIRSVIRPGDLPARLGGDEFAVLLRRADGAEADAVARRVLDAISQPLAIDGIELVSTASLGVAVTEDDDNRLRDLLHDADQAMYTAKREGRGRIARYSADARQETAARLELEADLRVALASGGLSLAYEPVVSLTNGDLVGAGATVRWVHPHHGQIPASSFLPLAARIGLLGTITDWAVREACWQARSWTELDKTFRTSVELPAAALHDSSFAAAAESVLMATDLPRNSLVLTVGADLLVDRTPPVLETMRRLRDAGVRIRLAGFGAASAPLDLLRRVGVDELEVSASFVTGLQGGAEDAAIGQAVIQLAHSFGLETVAQGVSSDQQRRQLENRHCDRAAGPAFGYPDTPSRITDLLTARMGQSSQDPCVPGAAT